MGKRIIVRRRGRGTSIFRSPTHKRVGNASIPSLDARELDENFMGEVKNLIHDPGKGVPLAHIVFENGQTCYLPAPEGLRIGQEIRRGSEVLPKIGNILSLKSIPEGAMICNIELRAGDGGRLARSSGSYATVVSHTPIGVQLKLPSGRSKYLDEDCRAIIGVVAGAGRTDKPFLKAGSKFKFTAARVEKWPHVRGQAMNAVDHPYGGGRHQHAGKPTTVSRNAPPGRKVGNIAARKTGRGKIRKRA
jgi:large subunit ribosomal protein L2